MQYKGEPNQIQFKGGIGMVDSLPRTLAWLAPACLLSWLYLKFTFKKLTMDSLN